LTREKEIMQFEPEDRYKYEFLSAAIGLHCSTSGASDPMTAQEAVDVYQWLKWRVTDAWQPPVKHWAAFDCAVRLVGLSACTEYEARDLDRDKKWIKEHCNESGDAS